MIFILAQYIENSPREAANSFGEIIYDRTVSFIFLNSDYLVCRLTVNMPLFLKLFYCSRCHRDNFRIIYSYKQSSVI